MNEKNINCTNPYVKIVIVTNDIKRLFEGICVTTMRLES